MKLLLSLSIAFILASLGIAFTITQTIPNTATIVSAGEVRAYWDDACTKPIEEIDWGNLATGKTYEKSFYLRNEGDTAVKLAWDSTLSEEIGIDSFKSGTIDINGYEILPNEIISTTYSIHVNPNAPLGDFSWSLIIGVK